MIRSPVFIVFIQFEGQFSHEWCHYHFIIDFIKKFEIDLSIWWHCKKDWQSWNRLSNCSLRWLAFDIPWVVVVISRSDNSLIKIDDDWFFVDHFQQFFCIENSKRSIVYLIDIGVLILNYFPWKIELFFNNLHYLFVGYHFS